MDLYGPSPSDRNRLLTSVGRYHVLVDRDQTILLIILLPFYFVAFGLYQFMIFAVNRKAGARERIPHSLFWRGWNLVRDSYKTLYPASSVYQLSLGCAVTVAVIGLAFVGLSVWEYVKG